MAATTQSTTALLTEHFRYTPLTLLDDIINTVNELVFRAVNAVEEGLTNMPAEQLGFKLDKAQAAALRTDAARREALTERMQSEIDNGIVQLESLLNATVDKDFDKFEIYTLRNILAVGHDEEDLANWVRLDHYSGVDVANAVNVPTPEEVQLQRRKLLETAKLNAMLKAEEAKNSAILSQLSCIIGRETSSNVDSFAAPFAFLQSFNHATQPQQLTQDTHYALTQVPALHRLLAQLKEAVQRIPNARHLRYDDEDSIEGRRRRYLSSQSRRALERRGIDADAATGAALAGGRRFGREDLEGIEDLAQSLRGDQKGVV